MFNLLQEPHSILVVDDTPSNLHLLHEAVRGLGNVYFATDGPTAIEKAKECQPEVILLDIEMPGMNGYDVLNELKAEPYLADTAVIFVTANEQEMHELKSLEAGGVDFIQKPINLNVTRARVNNHLTIQRQKHEIRRYAEDMSLLLHTLPAFIAYWDGEHNNVFCNDVTGAWFGKTPEQLKGQALQKVLPSNVVEVVKHSIDAAFNGEYKPMDVCCQVYEDKAIYGQLTIVPRNKLDTSQGFLMLITDVTARKLAEEALFDEKERIKITLDSIGDAVIATDLDGKVTFLNPIAESMTGWTEERALGELIEQVMPLRDGDTGRELVNPIRIALEEQRVVGMALNCQLGSSEESSIEVEDSAAPIRNHEGEVTGAIIVFHDVSEARAMALKMTHLAQHDALTNLPNRLLLRDRVLQALRKSQRTQRKVALIMFDIDDFKDVNEVAGHEAGDALLKEIAGELSKVLRPDDTLCRQGGDEFIILLSELDNSVAITRAISKVQDVFQAQWRVKDYQFELSVSIGASVYPDDSEDLDDLYRHCDAAMFAAKRNGKNQVQFYSREIEQKIQLKHDLELALRQSGSDHGFEVFYQAKCNQAKQMVVGFEALVRWRKNKDTLVFPDAFIPLCEETGLIIPLGKLVLEQACMQAVQWHAKGYNLQIAVNVSVVQFEDKDFIHTVQDVLEKTQLTPHLLELEITESVLAKDVDYAKETIHKLRTLGVGVALDDFGTGYSSLSYLKGFPLDVLKIDQSFVRNMLHSPVDQTIIKAIIQMAKGLNLKLIAEGVETEEHATELANMGCEIMQGYLFSKPVPVLEASQLLEQMNGAPRLN